MSTRKILLSLLLLLNSFLLFAQTRPFEQFVFLQDSLIATYPREKIFIHHDKPYYRLRDTIWLKGYTVAGPENISSDSSRLAYVEVIDAQGEVVKRISTPCFMGLFAGNIYLNERSFKQGQYRLRAYTRYQMNLGDSLFFEKRFTIIDPGAEEWKTRIQELRFADNRLLLSASLAGQTGQFANRTVSIRLRSKNKILFRVKAVTDAAGRIYLDTLINDADREDLQLEIADKDNVKLQIPVKNNKGLVDLQFMAEGGSFVAGIQQRLGFKAINAFGKGIDVKGTIKDSKGSVITNFASIHKGMGIVSLRPRLNETYTAFLENGLSFKLPVPQTSGVVLQLVNSPGSDSLQWKIEASPDKQNRIIHFVARSGGITATRGRLLLTAKGYHLTIPKSELLPGITVFTVYDETFQPINSRAVFIHHHNDLKLTLSSQKTEYTKKDSVSLTLTVQNAAGENVVGSFSMAVLDTSQVKVLPEAENLLSYMLLSADLKGEIEEPYYYFKNPDPEAVDALMLTQGWVSYERKPGIPAFAYERKFGIDGKVTNIFNKPLANAKVALFGKVGKGKAFVLDTVTNANGGFSFSRFPVYETDSISMMIQALNKKGRMFNVGVELSEPRFPAVNTQQTTYTTESILVDTVTRDYINRQQKIRTDLIKDGIVLEEVIVKSKRRIQGSKNLNEDGGADQVIDEEALRKTPKEPLLKILQAQVKGFRVGSPPRSRSILYMINSNLVRLVIDGIDVHFYYEPITGMLDEYKQFQDNYLNHLTAEDIKGIEIMNTPRHNASYRSRYLTFEEQISTGPVTIDFSFIEITTHSGNGAFLKKTPGMYLYKPVYPTLSKRFYSPRYTSPDEKTVIPDLRSTVYWNQDIVTDTTGKANVSFYTSESNSSYIIVVQGTDLKGSFGVLYLPLEVRKSEKSERPKEPGF